MISVAVDKMIARADKAHRENNELAVREACKDIADLCAECSGPGVYEGGPIFAPLLHYFLTLNEPSDGIVSVPAWWGTLLYIFYVNNELEYAEEAEFNSQPKYQCEIDDYGFFSCVVVTGEE